MFYHLNWVLCVPYPIILILFDYHFTEIFPKISQNFWIFKWTFPCGEHLCLFSSLLSQRKHQNSVLLARCQGVHWWAMDSPHKGQILQETYLCYEIIFENLLDEKWLDGSNVQVRCSAWPSYVTSGYIKYMYKRSGEGSAIVDGTHGILSAMRNRKISTWISEHIDNALKSPWEDEPTNIKTRGWRPLTPLGHAMFALWTWPDIWGI